MSIGEQAKQWLPKHGRGGCVRAARQSSESAFPAISCCLAAQTAPLKGVWSPKNHAILAFMRLNFLSVAGSRAATGLPMGRQRTASRSARALTSHHARCCDDAAAVAAPIGPRPAPAERLTLAAVAALALAALPLRAGAADYVVAPFGSDLAPGTSEQPWRTIQKCATTAAAGSTCRIRAGTYRETVTPNSGIVITAFDNELVTIDGADPITGWTLHQGSVYRASVTLADDDTNQVFVGGEMMTEARWPNGDDLFHRNWAVAQAGTTSTRIVDSQLPNVNWQGARAHIWSGTDPWAPMSATVAASQAGELTITPDGAPIGDYIALIPGGYYFLFGSLAALDAEREWHYDSAAKILYLHAPGGVDPNTIEVRAKRRPHALDLRGKSDVTVRGLRITASTIVTNALSARIVLDGLTVTYPSHYTRFADDPAYPGSGGYVHVVDSGVVLQGRDHQLRNSTVAYSAGNGVMVGGSHVLVQNNLIHHVNYAGNHAAGITILNPAASATIWHNTVHTSGGMLMLVKPWQSGDALDGADIGYNNLYGAMLMRRDGGAIYAGGPPPVTRSRIHHNWIHDTQDAPGPVRNWSMVGVYLDNAASGWQVDQNIFWNNPGYSIQVNGNAAQGASGPTDTTLRNNAVIDVAPRSYVFLNDIARCGSTEVADNLVLLSVVQTGAVCTASNNGPTAPGATEMTPGVQVGCDFAGCASSGPPAVANGVVAASVFMPPYDLRVEAGAAARFSVTGAGTPPLRYQWRRNGVAIAGATSVTYRTPPLSATDDGARYSVVVENALGSAESAAAMLNVRPGAADCLFDWAERNYPGLFAPATKASRVAAPYYYRYYAGTGVYLGLSVDDGHAYYLADGSLADAGLASVWYAVAHCP